MALFIQHETNHLVRFQSFDDLPECSTIILQVINNNNIVVASPVLVQSCDDSQQERPF